MGAFEDFVNLELPRRSTLLTKAITSYDADPNLGGAPSIIQSAPLGTWFYEETANKWWRKTSSTPASWTDQTAGGGGGGGGTGEIVRTYTAGVNVGDAVYQKSDGTADLADASAVATAETFLGFVRLKDGPLPLLPGQVTITFHGDLQAFTGLVTGATYVLGASPGVIVRLGNTSDPNYPNTTTGSGHVMREVGHAANATTLFVESSRDFEEF
jgi:hypothetical protein